MTKITSSLSQGLNTIANGRYSHAEGSNTEAKGNHSHAEGELTISIGKGSHSSGLGTIAFTDYQTAIGQYNTDKNIEDYFVVGNGTHFSRKNAFGISPTKTYISTSLLLPDLTKDSNIEILTYNTSTKQVHYGLLSELYIGKTDYATQASMSLYSELARDAKYSISSSHSIQSYHSQQSIISISSSYSDQSKNAFQTISSSFAINAQQANVSFSSSYSELAKNAITASYTSLAQQAKTAITASYIDDPDVVKTINDILKLKPVKKLPQILDPGAIVLYNKELYVNMGMIGWKKIMLSNENFY